MHGAGGFKMGVANSQGKAYRLRHAAADVKWPKQSHVVRSEYSIIASHYKAVDAPSSATKRCKH
jgi:hypothetical protein